MATKTKKPPLLTWQPYGKEKPNPTIIKRFTGKAADRLPIPMNKYLSPPFLTELNKINQLSLIDGDVKKSHFIFNSVFVEELNKINVIDLVAVTGNNAKQELQNLFTTVQHHTIVGVFFCLSFSNLPVMGELRLALALVRLWWGGCGNKPFIRRILHAVVVTVLNLPAALHLGRIITTSITRQKGITT